jgi:hypothetical protein
MLKSFWCLLIVSGCASHGVPCDAHLQAINKTAGAVVPVVPGMVR